MAVKQHRDSRSDHHYCEGCNRYFVSSESLWQHLRHSPAHQDVIYPDTESEESSSQSADSEDEDDLHCRICEQFFNDTPSYHQHRRVEHNWCSVCDRHFASLQALAQHDNSPVHKPKTHKCPLCEKYHKVPSATAHHMESGACHGCTRHHVTAAAQSMDITPSILASRRLQDVVSPPAITYRNADESAFNGTDYQCFLCSKTSRTLDGLNQHLNSAAHDENEFKCPKCEREFTVISALIQHIESEACGAARMTQVERIAHGLAAQLSRLLTFW